MTRSQRPRVPNQVFPPFPARGHKWASSAGKVTLPAFAGARALTKPLHPEHIIAASYLMPSPHSYVRTR